MNQSTNYNLKLYEGTDLFNPLTVENVNFNDLDTIVKGVSDAAIGRATELLTGTVHALTRADTDRDYFAFTATANFTAGDTFTLDGAQVSALTPDGQQLATGAYIIGSEVLVLVKGTLLTFILNPAKAPDADKLDGHDSSYFAKDSDMTQAQSDIGDLSTKVGSAVLTTTAQDCSGAINELNSNLADLGKSTLIASTDSTSSGNTESVPDIDQYRFLMISAGTAGGQIYNSVMIPVTEFKGRIAANSRVLVNAYIGGTEMNVTCYYVSDTSICLYTTNTYARVHGIK